MNVDHASHSAAYAAASAPSGQDSHTATALLGPLAVANPPQVVDAVGVSPQVPSETERTDEPSRWADLRSAAVEQVMRVCDDDLAVLPFLTARPGSPAAAAALGRLLTEHPQYLVAGCPLIALVTDTEPSRHWRDACPPREHSMHAQMSFLASVYGQPDEMDPYAAFRALSVKAEQDLAR